MSKRRKYIPEFKHGALEQTRQPGLSCDQIAQELGLAPNLLTRWRREADQNGQQALLARVAPELKKLPVLSVNWRG